MSRGKVLIQTHVPKDWIDYNGHMNDAEYVRAFSWGVDRLMKSIGIDDAFREEEHYTIYTLETHVCYLEEMKLGEPFEVHLHILDYDAKRIHVFYELYGENGKRAATSEQMLMGIDQSIERPAPFPDEVFTNVQNLAEKHTPSKQPKEAGRVIGIRK